MKLTIIIEEQEPNAPNLVVPNIGNNRLKVTAIADVNSKPTRQYLI
jgi:hypothetical protein